LRTIVIVGAVVCLGLAGCQQSKSEATETAQPEAPKYLSRSAPLYAGQEQILEVQSGSVALAKTSGNVLLTAAGQTPSAGYYQLSFVPRINAVRPADGIYDVDVVGYKPQEAAAQVVTPVEVKGEWNNAPVANLKGVRFIAKNNAVVAMLPTG